MMWGVPHCALSFSGFLALANWGGPRFRSAVVTNLAALIRCSLRTFVEWTEIFESLENAAYQHLPPYAVQKGQISPPFWKSKPL
eukprot:3093615-Pyramimonas_sp.AAC.2